MKKIIERIKIMVRIGNFDSIYESDENVMTYQANWQL
jgi:hypothetical protein